VTSIGNGAFQLTGLNSITIPDSVTSINTRVFSDCPSLTSVTIGDGVTSIGYSAFQLSGLNSITIPDSVTSIDTRAFSDCPSLTSVTIGDGVTSIGNYSFASCFSLTSITVPDGVTSIGSGSFYYCTSLATVNCLATTAPTLGFGVFSGILATEIHVPVGATGYEATYGGLTVVFDL
jgi:hypothetical protein